MAEFLKTKTGKNRMRYERAIADNAYDSIRGLHLIETQPEHFLGVLESGSVSTNNYLRGFHNFALDVGRLLRPVLYPVHGYGQSAFESSQVCGHVREQSGNANRPHLCPRQYRICDLVPHLGGAIYASSFFTSLMNTGR